MATTSTIKRGESKRGNAMLHIGTIMLCRSQAADLLNAVRNEPARLVEELAWLSGEAEAAKEGKDAKQALKVEAREAKAAASANKLAAERQTPEAKATKPAPVPPAPKAALLPVPTANAVAKAAITPDMLQAAKAAGVKGVHLYKNPASLQATIDAKAPAKPAPARTILTVALGEDNRVYTLFSDGSYEQAAIQVAA